ncbi:unnamed protein product, partial [Symbiodinium microadriaticum]
MSRLEIEMQFVDEYGHDCSMKNVKNFDIKIIYKLRYILDEEDTEMEVPEVILFSKKSLRYGMTKASLNFEKVYNEIKSKCGPAEDGYEVALMVSASYTIDGIKRALEFVIHLEVLTEDGVLPDITPGDIDVTIKRGGSGGAGDGVDVN